MHKKTDEIIHVLFHSKKNDLPVGLTQGESGLLLLSGQLAILTQDQFYIDKCVTVLESLVDDLSGEFVYSSLASGVAGLGWVVEFLVQNNIIDADTNEILGDIDKNVYKWMMAEQKKGNYDLLHGAIGGGLYFLKRISADSNAANAVEILIGQLLDQGITAEDGSIFWLQRNIGYYDVKENVNMGLSHGIPSVLAFFVKAYREGILKDRLYPFIRNLADSLLKYKQDFSIHGSCFPSHVYLDGAIDHQSRLAWCYGDLGVSCALWHANTILNDKSIESAIVEVLLKNAVIRNLKDGKILDSSFCHGASGAAYIFLLFYKRFGREEFLKASDFWYEELLKMDTFPGGAAGYKTWSGQSESWENNFGLLEGISGVAMSLLAKDFPFDNNWDEIYLIS